MFFYCISCGCDYALGSIMIREEFLTSVCLVSITQGKKIVLFGLPVSALSVGILDVYEFYIYLACC